MIITTVGKCQWCKAHKQKLVLCCGAKDGELRIAWLCEKCQEKLNIHPTAMGARMLAGQILLDVPELSIDT